MDDFEVLDMIEDLIVNHYEEDVFLSRDEVTALLDRIVELVESRNKGT